MIPQSAAHPPIPEPDLSSVRTVPVELRPNKVRTEEFASPPRDDRSFAAFLASLPDVLVSADFRSDEWISADS